MDENKIKNYDAEYVRNLTSRMRKTYEEQLIKHQLQNVFETIDTCVSKSYSDGDFIDHIIYNKKLNYNTVLALRNKGFNVNYDNKKETTSGKTYEYKISW